ncbi:dTMP kinase [Mesomycoplasma lagogenitalium]|uniref:Thymidylate kinase n=1 Tax=Mesomycoplasma lagogenitalium TaxID=171286 RepID=A0ABY8LST5_9BACT|nr:dTMP kinase [Mesomycoplasma lagogenitalium]WGI36317.1 dTMP kinase [Mesomycoplasma lagogenitalium]
MFITFEGLDGCGKSTIIKMLKEYLEKKYPEKNFVFTREPGGESVKESEKIREIILDSKNDISAMAETLLFAASRRIHLEKVVWPSLKNNKIVICDRYIDSSIAYQGAAGGVGSDKVEQINEIATDKTEPNYTFLLKLTPEESRKRLIAQINHNDDRIEKKSTDYFQKIYDQYEKMAKKYHKRFISIDASLTPDKVFKKVQEKIDEILSKKIEKKAIY